jgi:hypothetical protein
MNHRISALALLSLAACAREERTVSGTLDLLALGRSEATLIATTTTERREVLINADGRFELSLSPERWSIAFAEKDGGRVFAHLVQGQGATRSGKIAVSAGQPFDFGAVRPLAKVPALHLASGGNSGPGGDDDDDDDDDDDVDDSGSDDPSDDDREGCREVDPTTGAISLFTSFLVRGEADLDPAGSDDQPDPSDEGEIDGDGDDDDRSDDLDEDDDGDGICDEDQPADEPDGGTDDEDGRADLPYDARLEIGDTFDLSMAFAEKGPQPAAILSVEMDGGSWRLAELERQQPFTVDQSDCDHQGNREQGRDRIFVSWRNTDGSVEVDHLDLRYCGR